MNKAELIEALSDQTGQTRDETAKTLDALIDTIGSTLAKREKLLLVGFGTFETQHRAARTGRNPQTGAALEIPEAVVPKFSPGKALKDRIAEAHKPKEAPKAKSKKAKESPAKIETEEKPKKAKKK